MLTMRSCVIGVAIAVALALCGAEAAKDASLWEQVGQLYDEVLVEGLQAREAVVPQALVQEEEPDEASKVAGVVDTDDFGDDSAGSGNTLGAKVAARRADWRTDGDEETPFVTGSRRRVGNGLAPVPPPPRVGPDPTTDEKIIGYRPYSSDLLRDADIEDPVTSEDSSNNDPIETEGREQEDMHDVHDGPPTPPPETGSLSDDDWINHDGSHTTAESSPTESEESVASDEYSGVDSAELKTATEKEIKTMQKMHDADDTAAAHAEAEVDQSPELRRDKEREIKTMQRMHDADEAKKLNATHHN